MSSILTLATAALKPGELADSFHKRHPRVDYIELQRLISTDIVDYSTYNRTSYGQAYRSWETKLHSDIYLSLLGLKMQTKYDALFAMSERAGIPLAFTSKLMLKKKPLIAMFQCWSWRQELVITNLKLFSALDSILVHCNSMKRHFISLGVPEDKIHVVRYGRDHHFFSPTPQLKPDKGFVLSVGEARSRDYNLLFRAVDGLTLKLLVAASGSWYAREKRKGINIQPPANTKLSNGFSLYELRELYSQAQFVVLPVYNSVFSAGATATLEAMSMGRTVIATRSDGLKDYIIDGETGVLVEPGDRLALKEAIQDLLSNPAKAARLGQNARQRIEEELNLDIYVNQMSQLLQQYLPQNTEMLSLASHYQSTASENPVGSSS